MRVVNREEFLELPEDTMFSAYVEEDGFIQSNLMVKHESIVTDWIESEALEPLYKTVDSLLKAEEDINNGVSIPLNAILKGRNGEFDMDAKFAIYEKEDLIHLRNLIDKALL